MKRHRHDKPLDSAEAVFSGREGRENTPFWILGDTDGAPGRRTGDGGVVVAYRFGGKVKIRQSLK